MQTPLHDSTADTLKKMLPPTKMLTVRLKFEALLQINQGNISNLKFLWLHELSLLPFSQLTALMWGEPKNTSYDLVNRARDLGPEDQFTDSQ